jgi:type II secretory pathway pseudopilin PulG
MAQQMKQKFTILKALLPTLNKDKNSSKGFTLLELIVGLSIMFVVGGLAINAFIEASRSFNTDKKNIDSSQNLSAVLELIGNDIKQSGEQMNDRLFPVVKIEKVPAGDPDNMAGSSKITIRRALAAPLTLCQVINSTFTGTEITVTDNSLTSESNCQLGTPSTTTLPSTTIVRPARLKEARDKRCQLDDINGDYSSPSTTDFCLATKASPDLEQVSAAISDENGNMRTFKYVDDGAISITSYKIDITGLSPDTVNTYAIGRPIYLIEERVYALRKDGNLNLQIDGKPGGDTLIKRMDKFNVSARVYGDKDTKQPDVINAATPPVKPNLLPVSRRCDAAIPYYICEFNTTSVDDWKTIQGIKVELQAKYDGTGKGAIASAADTEKLKAAAEFFPRNVLSK